jgi:hypothetical protein
LTHRDTSSVCVDVWQHDDALVPKDGISLQQQQQQQQQQQDEAGKDNMQKTQDQFPPS